MALDLLDTPLRVTWDLHDGESATPADLASLIASRLVEAQAFFVTLETRPLLHNDCVALVGTLLDAGSQLELTMLATETELQQAQLLPKQVALTLDCAPWCTDKGIDRDGLRTAIERLQAAGPQLSCSLVPNRYNLSYLQPLLTTCRDAGVARFKLPNLRIDDSFRKIRHLDMVSAEALQTLREQVADAEAFRCGLQLDIHDLFLWEILFPDGSTQRSEYGGCQAANSLAHVDLQGIVYPCITWPHPLGNLAEATFAEIWRSAARHAVRDEIGTTPDGCQDCRDYGICFGGCRGLSREISTAHGRDPMCAGKR